MNQRCFEFYLCEAAVRKTDATLATSSLLSAVTPETETAIDAILARWGTNTLRYFMGLDATIRNKGVWPWAIAFYEKEFRLAGHVASLRAQRTDFSFTAYSITTGNYSIEEQGVPPFSILLVNNKSALERAAMRSYLFNQAWQLLEDKDEASHWVCIPSSPPELWVEQISKGDNALFLEIMGLPPGTGGPCTTSGA